MPSPGARIALDGLSLSETDCDGTMGVLSAVCFFLQQPEMILSVI